MAKASFTLLAAAMAIVALVTPAVAIEEQCSACQAINVSVSLAPLFSNTRLYANFVFFSLWRGAT